ncbi:MAG: glycerol-3-phosphate acyltransferase [Oscillospiraceae bacterium]|nr:glycerol-3-phosphate acyltransferase [Oscillospiraceae bacterium]
MKFVMLALAAVIGYVLGGLNGSIIVSKCFAHDDVRKKGSGNAGLTNFYRNYGGAGALLVIAIDVAKVVAASLIGGWLLGCYGLHDEGKMLAGTFCMLGHIFPVEFGFRGGKGVLSSAALAAVMDWRIFAIVFSVFLIVVVLTKYVSLGSVLAAVAYPIAFWLMFRNNWVIVLMSLLIALIAIAKHHGNIERLMHGNERKLTFKKSKGDT